MKQDSIPDILNSRNERVILELPNYSYCHSSQTQGKNHSFFLGRQSLLHKLKNLLSTATGKTGVYLVTGNRGVGKSRLVEEVIKETSIQKRSIANYISFIFVALFLTLGLQYATNQDWGIDIFWWWFMFIAEIVAAVILFFVIGHNSYLRKKTRQYEKPKKLSGIGHTFNAILKDFLVLSGKTNPFLRTRNVLKLALLLLLIQIFAAKTCFTHFQLFIIYLCAVSGYYYVRYAKQILIQEYRKSYDDKFKDWKYKNKKVSLANAFNKWLQGVTLFIVIVSIATAVFSMKYHWWWLFIGMAIMLVTVFITHWYVIALTLIKDKELIICRKCKALKFTWEYSYPQLTSLSNRINHYIKNSSRVYLKINFGHDVLNERDMLRLITRTLTIEYENFRKSWIHTLYWRALALAVLLAATHLFYKNILPEIKKSDYYVIVFQTYDRANDVMIQNYSNEGAQVVNNIFLQKQNSNNDNIKNKLNVYLKYTLYKIDSTINRTCNYIANVPNYISTKNINKFTIKQYNYNINYAWLLIFLTFYLLGCLLLRLKFFTTPYTIKRQLKQLNENITYSTEREISARIGDVPQHKPHFSIRKKQTRIIADAREIEKELQDILENIQKIPAFMARPEFVIVFDELDKVSPETQIPAQESETKHKETLFASDSTRERQAVILKLLSNMKYFLSTANAKFIFIAGREMYDMYLADIADRNNYFGSIFNDVIFVPSLLADVERNKKQYNITTLVEEYVCRHLIPEDYPNIEYNLKEYDRYLDDKIYKDVEIEKQQQVNMKKQKIIATLQQFIIYLAHTSKGAPKKMVQIFESFIESYENKKLSNRYLDVKQFRSTKLYLNFDYYDQYTIGMTSYLMTPVFNRLSDANIQEHSDKLLVSTLHFVDYMMKFHSQNFSWRSIDISPELIEINRSPELKAIVNDIVTLFEQIHFHKPVISLYEFKFDALLAQEIFFLSKMDERSSAQFNFSLDESLILKEYYKSLLKEKQAEYKKYKTYGENYVSSIASLQIVLGDLYFLDDELDVAALYYKDGLYLLQKQLEKDENRENLEIFYLFIRNQLKLAYLYEKRKQADFAYLLYGELTTLLIKYRDFDLEKYGISIRKDGEKDYIMVKHKGEKTEPYDKNVETPIYSPHTDSYIYEKKNTCSYTCEWEHNEEWQGNKSKAKIRPMQFEELSPATQQVMFKNMTIEGLQLLYLPLLAKLQILEKCSLVGILAKDIKLIQQEFEFLTRTIDHSEVKILAADFYSKIGDILFYKNKVFSSPSSSEEQPEQNTDSKKIDISHYACLYYKKAFIALAVKTGEEEEKTAFEGKTILQILQDQEFKKAKYIDNKLSTRYRSMMARVLSNLGDVYFQATERQCLSCEFYDERCPNCPFWIASYPEKGENENDSFWNNWWKFIDSNKEYKLPDFITAIHNDSPNLKLSNVELVLLFYSISMKYYRKAGQHKHYAFQVAKILNCMKYCLRHNIHSQKIKYFLAWDDSKKEYKNLKALASQAIRSLYLAYDSLNMFDISKRKEDFDRFSESYNNRNTPLQYIQVDSEVSRIRTFVKELELELVKDDLDKKVKTVKKIYAQYITSPYHTNYSVSARIHRLRVKDRLNREAYDIMKEVFQPQCTYSCSRCKCSKHCKKEIFFANDYFCVLSILTEKKITKDANGWPKKDIVWEDHNIRSIFDNIVINNTDIANVKYKKLFELNILQKAERELSLFNATQTI